MDTTNIDDLPSDQVAMGGDVAQQHNITMQMSEAGAGMQGGSPMVGAQHQSGYTPNTVSEPNTTYNPNISVNAPSQRSGEGANSAIHEQKLMNELVTGLQQASAGGATSLPSRDIPTTTTQYQDEQTRANYVPSAQQEDNVNDYIDDSDQGIINNRLLSRGANKDPLETIYDEFQTPIILILLFFLYQLPVVRLKVLYLLPSLHDDLGNPNISGYILNSVLFGVLYYVIMKSIQSLQQL